MSTTTTAAAGGTTTAALPVKKVVLKDVDENDEGTTTNPESDRLDSNDDGDMDGSNAFNAIFSTGGGGGGDGVSSLEQLFEEVETTCRRETRELYVSEGKEASLGPAGVPESLQHWLDEVGQ
jgi:hypothetical protein